MKYIKTKAGEIYDIDDLYICDDLNGKPYGVKDSSWLIYKESIIRQADTIEELCDEFVDAYENGARIVYGDSEWAKVKAKASSKNSNKLIIYGAIWTEWGLKYIAKMNSNGELELL